MYQLRGGIETEDAAMAWGTVIGLMSGAGLAIDLQTLVEISPDRLYERLDLAVKEMVRSRDYLLLDHDPFLRFKFLDQGGDILMRHDRIFVAVNNHTRGRARGEK